MWQKEIRVTDFLPLNFPVEKQMYEINILELRNFIMLQNILFMKDFLRENAAGSFNDKFHPSKLLLNHTARSTSTCQLEANKLKRERYGRKSIVNKCTVNWNWKMNEWIAINKWHVACNLGLLGYYISVAMWFSSSH